MKKHEFATPIAPTGGHSSLFPREFRMVFASKPAGSLIYVRWFDDKDVPRLETTRTGQVAHDKIAQLNKANNALTSLHTRLLTEFATELNAYAVGTPQGTDD